MTALERTLAQGQASDASLIKFQRLVDEEEAFPSLLLATRGVRASLDGFFGALNAGNLRPSQIRRSFAMSSPSFWTPAADDLLFSLDSARLKEGHATQVEFWTDSRLRRIRIEQLGCLVMHSIMFPKEAGQRIRQIGMPGQKLFAIRCFARLDLLDVIGDQALQSGVTRCWVALAAHDLLWPALEGFSAHSESSVVKCPNIERAGRLFFCFGSECRHRKGHEWLVQANIDVLVVGKSRESSCKQRWGIGPGIGR